MDINTWIENNRNSFDLVECRVFDPMEYVEYTVKVDPLSIITDHSALVLMSTEDASNLFRIVLSKALRNEI